MPELLAGAPGKKKRAECLPTRVKQAYMGPWRNWERNSLARKTCRLFIMDNKQLGNLTELQCITRFYELGYSVSTPYGDSEKYDMILDFQGLLLRLQCKHAKEFFTEDGQLSHLKLKTSWQSGYTKTS